MAKAKNTAKVNFTAGQVAALTCSTELQETYLWDSTQPGLGLRARASGSKTYIFQRRLNGNTIKISIGSPDDWDIDQARAEVRRLGVLIDNGQDPRQEAKDRQTANTAARLELQRAGVTVGTAWNAYIKANWQRWGEHHRINHMGAMQAPGQPYKRCKGLTIAGPLYSLYNERLAALDNKRLERLLAKETAKRPTATAQCYRMLRAFLSWCDEQPEYQGLAKPGAVLTKSVKRMVPATKAKQAALQKEQLAPWFDAVKKIGNPSQSTYLQALLLTGARPNEIKTLRWPDIDFQWRMMTIHDKVEGERTIPLPPYLAQLLNALPRRNEWVFSSADLKAGHISEANHALTRAMQTAGLPHITPHDLRRSFGTLSEWVECPVGVVAQIQGHKPSALAEKHYRVRPIDLLRKWHTKIEGWILEQAGIVQPAENEALGLRAIQVSHSHKQVNP